MGRRPAAITFEGWHVDELTSQTGNITIKDKNRKTVARVPFDSEKIENPNDLARARLIVAAPDLLAALTEYHAQHFRATGTTPEAIADRALHDRAQAALTKTTEGA